MKRQEAKRKRGEKSKQAKKNSNNNRVVFKHEDETRIEPDSQLAEWITHSQSQKTTALRRYSVQKHVELEFAVLTLSPHQLMMMMTCSLDLQGSCPQGHGNDLSAQELPTPKCNIARKHLCPRRTCTPAHVAMSRTPLDFFGYLNPLNSWVLRPFFFSSRSRLRF